MSAWHSAIVRANQPAADDLIHLVLDVSQTTLASAHLSPGQYVKLKVEGVGEGFFAIASAPGSGETFEFLIKRGTPLANAVTEQTPGSTLLISQPQGKGFPLVQARGKNLLLFATGSGIGAIRPVIEMIRRERNQYGTVTLFFGARTPSAFAFDRELDAWQANGIQVLRTVSQPGSSGWQGLTGYVQSHLSEVPVENALAFLVGQKAMVEAVTSALVARGLPKANVFLNF